jgi:hypothetical protein
VPPKGAPVLKLIKQISPWHHEMQALQYHDKAVVAAALDTDAACGAAFDLLHVADVREAVALA